MVKIILIYIIILFISLNFVYSKQDIDLFISNAGDTCIYGPKIWILDDNKDNIYDIFIYGGCSNSTKAFQLFDKSQSEINQSDKAILVQGGFANNNFLVYILDSINSVTTHKIYYDATLKRAVLEDVSESEQNNIQFDNVDNYFSTYIQGSFVRLIKKTDISIKAIKLCTIEGIVLDNKQIYDNQSEYFFDLFGQPTGMYFIWILTNDKVFVKKIIYTP